MFILFSDGYDKNEIDYIWKYKEKEENLKFGTYTKVNRFVMEDFRALREEKSFGETG